MKILYFCPIWGNSDVPIEAFVSKVKNAGYDGVELSLPLDNVERDKDIAALKKADLLYLGQHWETVTLNFEEHKKEYVNRLYNLAGGNPILIDSQTGIDFYSFEQNMELVNAASAFTNDTGIPVVHETHRGKFSFAAHITRQFLEANPDHIHARVGFQEGPQIPDPRAPEWKEVVEKHISWWERILERARKENREYFTISPEFGPHPYMTILPYTRQPIADQWEVNVYMMNMLKERFQGF